MAGFWGKRKRDEQELEAQDADLAKRADSALVAADERIRVTSDELVFAEAELGSDSTKALREALVAVRTHLGEAFRLNQLNHDHIPDTREELRTRNARIVQLCDWAEDVLDEHTSALDPRSTEQMVQLTDRLIRSQGLTTLMVTHSIPQAVALGDRVLVVNRGRIVESIGGARKRRLRVEDLLDTFDRLRSGDLVDESAAEMVRRLYI